MSSNGLPNPRPGEFWATSKGRTVEILARRVVIDDDAPWDSDQEVDTVAYRFLGGSQVHLRSASSLKSWTKVEFE